jgi:GNAT superfamily N-acetyltransferase
MEDDVQALERAEIEAVCDLYRAARPDAVEAAGLAVEDLGFTRITAAARVDVLALNRAIGLGLETLTDAAEIDRVLDRFAALGSPRFFIPVAPAPGAGRTMGLLEQRGLRHHNNWMRLRRALDADIPSGRPASSIDVRRIGAAEASVFSTIVATAFQYPPQIAQLPGQAVGRARWTHYLACDAGTPIGAAAMYVTDRAAWFGFAATLPGSRGRGAQTALVLRRLGDAREAGCRWVSVETAEQTSTRDAPSFRNLTRVGFEVAYRRPNYLWTRPAATAEHGQP